MVLFDGRDFLVMVTCIFINYAHCLLDLNFSFEGASHFLYKFFTICMEFKLKLPLLFSHFYDNFFFVQEFVVCMRGSSRN